MGYPRYSVRADCNAAIIPASGKYHEDLPYIYTKDGLVGECCSNQHWWNEAYSYYMNNVKGQNIPLYSSSVSYNVGDKVKLFSNFAIYQCLQACSNVEPSANPTYWQNVDATVSGVKTIEICMAFNCAIPPNGTTWDGTFSDFADETVAISFVPSNTDIRPINDGTTHSEMSIGFLKPTDETEEDTINAPLFIRLPNGYQFAPDNEVISDTIGVNKGSSNVTTYDMCSMLCGEEDGANFWDGQYYGAESFKTFGTVAITMDGENIKIYANGRLKQTLQDSLESITLPSVVTNYQFQSFDTDVSHSDYPGTEDKAWSNLCAVRLYDRVLSEVELKNNALVDKRMYGCDTNLADWLAWQ